MNIRAGKTKAMLLPDRLESVLPQYYQLGLTPFVLSLTKSEG